MKRTRFVAIGGFLGAGKTTTGLKALEALQKRGLKGAYIANDQGEGLVDTALAVSSGAHVGEVTGGCFCCRFDELSGTAVRLAETLEPDVILAEAVGSCTDLVATVINPLKMYHARRFEVAPYTVVVDPVRYNEINGNAGGGDPDPQGPRGPDNVAYLFNKQLEEAHIVAVNKLDLLPQAALPALTRRLQVRAPGARIVPYSAHTGTGLEELLAYWLGGTAPEGRALELDYDTYAAAEEELAWVNLALNVTATAGGFQPTAWVQRLLTNLDTALVEAQIGHVKVSLTTENGFTKASLVRNEGEVTFTHTQTEPVARGEVRINARAQLDPSLLEERLQDALEEVNATFQVRSQVTHRQAFRPARPEPTYRLGYDGRRLSR